LKVGAGGGAGGTGDGGHLSEGNFVESHLYGYPRTQTEWKNENAMHDPSLMHVNPTWHSIDGSILLLDLRRKKLALTFLPVMRYPTHKCSICI
jgi:hypothetical protein